MGAAVSTNVNVSKQTNINNTIMSTIMKTSQLCSSSQLLTQDVNVSFVNSNTDQLTVDANLTADISCIQTAQHKATLQAAIKNDLKALVQQDAAAGPSLFSFGISTNVSTQQQDIINNISQSLDISTIQESVARQTLGQRVNVDVTNSTVKNILVSASGTAVIKAVQDDVQLANSVADLANTMANTSTQKATSGLTIGAIIVLAILICCMLCIGGYYLFSSSKGGSSATGGQGTGFGSQAAAQLLNNPALMNAVLTQKTA